MDSDLLLIMKMKRGDDMACEQFVRKYYGDILKYCNFHCQNRDWSEDLTQETFLKFFASLPKYRHQGKAKNYLYTIAANLCKNLAASKKELSLENTYSISIDPFLEIDDGLLLENAVRKLPGEYRELIILHYYQGIKLSEAAEILKIGLPLAKYRINVKTLAVSFTLIFISSLLRPYICALFSLQYQL